MDERTSTRFSAARLAALSAVALLCAACGGGSTVPATGSFRSENGGFSCELPGVGWQRRLNISQLYLGLKHDEFDSGFHPDIDVYEHKSRTREELEALRAGSIEQRKDDPNFKALPIQEIRVDGRVAWIDDQTFINALAATMHRPAGTPAFKPVLYRETTIFVTGPKKSYIIRYSAPVSLYDKHRPAFDRLLAGFRFE